METNHRRHGRCSSRSRVTAKLLLSFLALSAPVNALHHPPLDIAPAIPPFSPVINPDNQGGARDFTLRQVFHHGTYRDPHLHKRLDIQPDSSLWTLSSDGPLHMAPVQHLSARSHKINIERLVDRRIPTIEAHLEHARLTGQVAPLSVNDWTLDEVDAPNITDKDTVINLAIMAADAYVEIPGQGDWEDVKAGFNHSQNFGWEDDGLRGHIFADQQNRTIVISMKGTSAAVFDGDGTTTKDKLNDNLFASCCCAQGGQYFWRQVCDCYSTTYTCNQTCLVQSLKHRNRYYQAAIELYTNVTELYPDSNIWLTGHSLGGVVTSLLGMTFGLPTVTFEAYGDALAASRLGLPSPPGLEPSRPQDRRYSGTYHFGHTADPVFMGTCNGATATCTLGGYAMESQCHTGLQCVYDTVSDLGWRVGIGNHRIHVVINDVLRKYNDTPKCVPDNECYDCFNWKYFHSNGSATTTSSSSTVPTTRTRTSTCKTPGWWGCLDSSTTTTTTSSTSLKTATITTTTCKTRGWFGCKDLVTTTITTTEVAAPAPSATFAPTNSISPTSYSCEHPGFFGGCRDKTSASASASASVSKTGSMSPTPHHCKTPGYFWGCKDKHTLETTKSYSITAPPISSLTTLPSPTKTKSTCTQKAWFGLICLDPTSAITVTKASSAPAATDTRTNYWKSEI